MFYVISFGHVCNINEKSKSKQQCRIKEKINVEYSLLKKKCNFFHLLDVNERIFFNDLIKIKVIKSMI